MLKVSIYKTKLKSILPKCTVLWNKQNRSSVAGDLIHDQLKIYFVTPKKTRWNSTYDSLKCIPKILFEKETNLNFICDRLEIPRFCKIDVDFIDEYLRITGTIANSLDLFQGEKNMYAGYLLPTLKEIKTQLEKLRHNLIF